MFKKICVLLPVLLWNVFSFAQSIVADKIIAVVGNKAILQSDLNLTIEQRSKNNMDTDADAKCEVLRDMIAQKILAEEAYRDSAINARITDEAVNAELQRKIDYFVQNQFGSVEKMEQYMGKTIYQLKEDSRESVKDDLLASEMRTKVLENVKVTPNEVKQFFNALSEDEKRFYPASVEVGQIVIKPDVSPEVDEYTKSKLEDIRKQIVEGGKDFAMMAGIYGEDGTKDNGGELTIDRKNFDPDFVAAAYRLQPGEVSPVIKTQFGYHIIQMIKRMGEQAQVRHIVMIPAITPADARISLAKLDSIRKELIAKKITFQEAVGKYSNDKDSKMSGGMILDPQTGSSILAIDQLDATMALAIGDLKVGDYSQPQQFQDQYGRISTRILYLRTRTDPHKANLNDDYSQIQSVTLMKKQNEYMLKWLVGKLPTHYLKLDAEYQHCEVLADWYKYAAQ